jgi:hypothetical protein
MSIKWIDKITNEELRRITKQKPIELQIKGRKWIWIGHTLYIYIYSYIYIYIY